MGSIDTFRIGVVGGGFAGLIFALRLAEHGFNVDLYEEHDRVGYPPHCTGLVSERVVRILGQIAVDNIIGWYRGLSMGLGDRWVYIEPIGGIYRLDRVRLEHDMLDHFESLGGRAHMGVRVKRVEPSGLLYAGNRESRYDLIILSDGYHGVLHKSLDIGYEGSIVYGLNLIYSNAMADDIIKVDFDPNVTSGLFAWILRIREGALLGTGVRDPGLIKLYVRRLEEKYNASAIHRIYGGPILLGPPARRLYIGKVVVVGDAAGLNKPLTGGGLYPNALAAELASKMIADGMDPLKSIINSVTKVALKLKRQYRIAKIILKDLDVLSLLIDASIKSGLPTLLKGKIDYDEHELIFRYALSYPISALKLLYHLLKRPMISLRIIAGLLL